MPIATIAVITAAHAIQDPPASAPPAPSRLPAQPQGEAEQTASPPGDVEAEVPDDGTVILTSSGDVDIAATAAAADHLDAGDLDPGLVSALSRARDAAAEEELEVPVSSGYRSPRDQAQTLADELAERGDLEQARRWVFAPDRSMHVRGLAIDINSGPAADWLDVNGASFGLCRTLAWEWWHFEWRESWQQRGACPTPAAEPSEAPGS